MIRTSGQKSGQKSFNKSGQTCAENLEFLWYNCLSYLSTVRCYRVASSTIRCLWLCAADVWLLDGILQVMLSIYEALRWIGKSEKASRFISAKLGPAAPRRPVCISYRSSWTCWVIYGVSEGQNWRWEFPKSQKFNFWNSKSIFWDLSQNENDS